jgi:hypothetical protein
MGGVLETHIQYLSDAPRIEAFRRAISDTVRPGDVVVDVGAGTGVLSLMACAAGASRVYAIEQGPIIALARKIAALNGCSDRIHFIRDHSSTVKLPELGDVLVSDLVGPFAFEAGLLDVVTGAPGKLLKPGGRIIPGAITLKIAPLELPRLRERMHFGEERPAGFDMSVISRYARNTAYHLYPDANAVLSPAAEVAHYALPISTPPALDSEVTVQIARDGKIDAVAGWFDARLAPGVHMTNDPSAPERLDRCVAVLPVFPAISVERGDVVIIALRLLTSDHVYRWRVQRRRADADASSFTGCTLEGVLMSREDLAPYQSQT